MARSAHTPPPITQFVRRNSPQPTVPAGFRIEPLFLAQLFSPYCTYCDTSYKLILKILKNNTVRLWSLGKMATEAACIWTFRPKDYVTLAKSRWRLAINCPVKVLLQSAEKPRRLAAHPARCRQHIRGSGLCLQFRSGPTLKALAE